MNQEVIEKKVYLPRYYNEDIQKDEILYKLYENTADKLKEKFNEDEFISIITTLLNVGFNDVIAYSKTISLLKQEKELKKQLLKEIVKTVEDLQ